MKRFLRVNHKCSAPKQIVVVDTETLPHPHPTNPNVVHHVFRLGVAIRFRFEGGRRTRRRELHFTDPSVFWSWVGELLAPHQPVHVFAHNLAFDLTALRFWERLAAREYTFERPASADEKNAPCATPAAKKYGLLSTEDPPTVVECWHRSGGRICCLDTLNWHRASLETLATEMDMVKVPLPCFTETDEAWFKRCLRDAEILEKVVLRLLDDVKRLDLGMFRYTVNAQAMACFRHRHLDAQAPPSISTDKKAKEFERKSLYFARQFVYWSGSVILPEKELSRAADPRRPGAARPGPIHVLDVNSCYPSVMRYNLFPRELVKVDESGDLDELRRRLVRPTACAEVEIDSDFEPYPVHKHGRLWWSTGRFWTHLCGAELVRAVVDGDVRAVRRVQWYSVAELFTSYVNEWWQRRLAARAAGDAPGERFAKAMLLGLHGKWGQQRHAWEYEGGVICPNPWGVFHEKDAETKKLTTYRSVGWTPQRETKGGETPQGFPAITSWINAYAREKMRRLCREVGEEELIWEDCDQLAVTSLGLARLQAGDDLIGDELGQLRWQWSATEGRINGVRNYSFGNYTLAAGLARNARQVAAGEWEQEEWSRLNGQLMGPPPPGPTVEKVRKTAPQPFQAGREQADGSFRHYRWEDIPHES